jgi:hypothetical protein
MPVFFCSNPEMQKFCEEEAFDFNPYKVQLTACELLQVCKERFGLRACYDFEFWIH